MSGVPSPDAGLDLAVALCNTYDLLDDPPDRLRPESLPRLADRLDWPELAGLAGRLSEVRRVRTALYAVFADPDPAAKIEALNGLLAEYKAELRLIPAYDGGAPRLGATGGEGPVGRLAVACAGALARVVADGGADRVRTCVADPCRCVYVDRTRANRQRYCCELCNDRMASAAYRRRRG
ncbi:CGNR zinc finger domain-containing protein [Hamadaea tsunoensis]|uniref:CGNR zinc finger domain-containing protein n=1 Tax=Hamadaea tsunoensis TaxID=53368 RepID=UPI0003F55005|nr:CGNR zinc finger domain-containing protein [Hamadaea tsunoensis]